MIKLGRSRRGILCDFPLVASIKKGLGAGIGLIWVLGFFLLLLVMIDLCESLKLSNVLTLKNNF